MRKLLIFVMFAVVAMLAVALSSLLISPDVSSPNIGTRGGGPTLNEPETPPTAAETMSDARKKLQGLPNGKIVLDAPKAMKVGERRAVHSAVGVGVPPEQLKRYVRRDSNEIETDLKVSHEMIAVLSGPSFAITPITPEKQKVVEGRPTFWSWDIEAKTDGEQELEATLYALIPTPGSGPARVDSFSQKIRVTVKEQTLVEWLKSSKEALTAIQALILTITSAAAVIFGVLRWLDKRRGETQKDAKSASE